MKNIITILVVIILAKSECFSQDSLFLWPSGKKIEIIVNANVIDTNSILQYNYLVKSRSISIQNVHSFYVEFNSNISAIKSPNFWLGQISGVWSNVLMWGSRDTLYDISPSDSLYGFSYESEGLPSIQKYYGVGFYKLPSFKEGEAPAESDIVGGGILENSVKGYTISPKDLPNPFIPLEFIDTLITYADSSYSLGWITDEQTRDKYNNYFNTAKTSLEQGDSSAARAELEKVLTDCNADSSTVLTSEAYALLYFNTEYLVNKLPEGEPGLPVKLQDSQGSLLQGGSLQYYDAGWKDAIDNGDGTFTVQTEKSSVSLKMVYAGGSQQVNNVTVGSTPYVFQTINAEVQLKDFQGNLLDGGTVKYYASGWKDFGEATNGSVTKELLPREYTFRMEYGGANQDKKQNIDSNNVVVFQTVNAEVQLKDSQGNFLDGGTVKYYASGWKDFGEAVNGSVTKELLPRKYTFQIKYGGASINKDQDISNDPVVVFQTVKAVVQLKDSQGNLLDGGTASFYAKSWQEIGTTANGEVTKELLPRSYTFRMTYGYVSNDKAQDIGSNPVVEFSTIPVTVSVKDSSGDVILGAEVQYYSKQWNVIGNTDSSGEITIEMLPKNITFRVKYNSQTTDKQQNTAENSLVEFVIE